MVATTIHNDVTVVLGYMRNYPFFSYAYAEKVRIFLGPCRLVVTEVTASIAIQIKIHVKNPG